jgi:hypothetical protein
MQNEEVVMTNDLDICEELWDNSVVLQIVDESDSTSEVDGVHILAKVRGPAFFPDVVSGNKVLYPKEAWVNAISDPVFQRKLNDRLIYGTIGHGIKLDDDAIRNGKFSHIVTDIGIDESNVGYGEYLVLNTPSGRILNTILRAKSKIRVSTKARGLFKDTKNGIKTINPDAFKLERVDFVIDPGYLQAHPDLVESLNEISGKDNNMDLEESKLEEYAKIGTLDQITESLNLLATYTSIGTPDEINENLDKATETVNHLKEVLESNSTTVAESIIMNKDINEELAAFRSLGSVSELQKVVESADKLVNYIYKGKVKYLSEKYSVNESKIHNLINSGTDLSIIEELLDDASVAGSVEYVLDDEGNPVLDADGNPVKKMADTLPETAESRRKVAESKTAASKKFRLISEEDGTEYEVDGDGNPILDADGNPVKKAMAAEESRQRVAGKKFKLVNEEDGTEYLTDDEGNPVLDADGNPVPKEKKEDTSESRKGKFSKFKLVNEEDGTEYEMDADGNPLLDADGNPIPKKETPAEESRKPAKPKMKLINEEDGVEYKLDADGNPMLDADGNPIPMEKKEDTSESRRHSASTSRFNKVNESKSTETKPFSYKSANPILTKLFSGKR